MIALFILLTTPVVNAEPRGEAQRETDLLCTATESYRAGLEARADGAKARPLFRRAAQAYERCWLLGYHHPAIARDMAQAHLLAGDLARAIRAYRRGLRIAPNDRDLQNGLAFTRAQVAYPLTGNLADSCRPLERKSLLRYASADSLRAIAAGLYFLGLLAFARAWMTRRNVWWAVGIFLSASAVALGGRVWWEESLLVADNRLSLAIVAEPGTSLHRGNGAEYPRRFPDALPAGVELRILNERGGWLQVQLAGGEVGWVDRQRVVWVESWIDLRVERSLGARSASKGIAIIPYSRCGLPESTFPTLKSRTLNSASRFDECGPPVGLRAAPFPR